MPPAPLQTRSGAPERRELPGQGGCPPRLSPGSLGRMCPREAAGGGGSPRPRFWPRAGADSRGSAGPGPRCGAVLAMAFGFWFPASFLCKPPPCGFSEATGQPGPRVSMRSPAGVTEVGQGPSAELPALTCHRGAPPQESLQEETPWWGRRVVAPVRKGTEAFGVWKGQATCCRGEARPRPAPSAAHRCWSASGGGRSEPLSPASGGLGTERDTGHLQPQQPVTLMPAARPAASHETHGQGTRLPPAAAAC